jgi:signal transduction histidine kinase
MNTSITHEPRLALDNVDLGRLTTRCSAFYQHMADTKRIRISCDAPAGVSVVRTDRIAVAAVLDNLLSNAIKYTPAGGHVTVTVAADGTHAVCSVRDTGPGLSEEDQGRLFQRGTRLSSVPTGGEPSAGYGLAVAKELVNRLGGEIWCESHLGSGTCFAFRLPRA